jgi:hypothetical protein
MVAIHAPFATASTAASAHRWTAHQNAPARIKCPHLALLTVIIDHWQCFRSCTQKALPLAAPLRLVTTYTT